MLPNACSGPGCLQPPIHRCWKCQQEYCAEHATSQRWRGPIRHVVCASCATARQRQRQGYRSLALLAAVCFIGVLIIGVVWHEAGLAYLIGLGSAGLVGASLAFVTA